MSRNFLKECVITIIWTVIIQLLWKLIKQANNIRLPKVAIKFKTLLRLRLSAITSEAYKQCIKQNLKIVSFNLYWRKVVFIADPKIMQEIQTNYNGYGNRGSYYNDTLDWHLFNMTKDSWALWKRNLSKNFGTIQVRSYSGVFNRSIQKCLEKDIENPVDVFKICSEFIYRTSCELFLSCDDMSHEDVCKGLIKCRKLFQPNKWNHFVDVFGYICPKLLRTLNVCDVPIEVFEHFNKLAFGKINNIDALNPNSFIYQLVINKVNESNRQIIGILIGLIVGNIKSTATFLTYLSYELAKNTDIQMKLRNEIQQHFPKNVENGCDTEVIYEKISNLKYLQQVLKEVLRLHSGGPLFIRETTENCDLLLKETNFQHVHIPKGSLVMASIREILMNPRCFENPSEFDPSRFQNSNNIELDLFKPFGFGRRRCIGDKLALQQASIFVIRLLSNYSLKLHEKTFETFHDKKVRLWEGHIYINMEPIKTL